MKKKVLVAVSLVIVAFAPFAKSLPASTDTEASVNAEIAALQTKLDDILYLSYFKELKEAFLHSDLWGNNEDGTYRWIFVYA